MKSIESIRAYLIKEVGYQTGIAEEERASSPDIQVTEIAMGILARVKTSHEFHQELQSARNLTNHEDKEYLQAMKRVFNRLLEYTESQEGATNLTSGKDNWETEEVIRWLINDPSEVLTDLQGMDGEEIHQWVIQGNAPDGLYQSFNRPPTSTFKDVDWDSVEESVNAE